MLRPLLLPAILLGLGFAMPGLACDLLAEAELRQAVPAQAFGGAVSQTSEVPGRCLYQWARPNQAERRQANDEALIESMRRGSEGYRPAALWSELSIEILAVAPNEAEARALLARYAAGRTPEGFGSPDPLAGSQLEALKTAQANQQVVWDRQRRQLLLRAGTRLLLLGVDVDDDDKKNEAIAAALAAKLK